jgi:hypothetical protein
LNPLALLEVTAETRHCKRLPWVCLLTSLLRPRCAMRHWTTPGYSLAGAEVGAYVGAMTTDAGLETAERPSLLMPTRRSNTPMAKAEQGHRSPFHWRYAWSRSSRSQEFDNRFVSMPRWRIHEDVGRSDAEADFGIEMEIHPGRRSPLDAMPSAPARQ